MRVYDYLFYKFYRLAVLLDKRKKEDHWLAVISVSMMFCFLEGLLLSDIIDYLDKIISFGLSSSRFISFLIVISLIILNALYFFHNNRWKTIIKKYENENKTTGRIKSILIAIFVILYIVGMYKLTFYRRQQILDMTYKKKSIEELVQANREDVIKSNFSRNELTSYISSNKFVFSNPFNWEKSERLASIIGKRDIIEGMGLNGQQHPNGYVYEVDYAFRINQFKEKDIIGFWKIDAKGKIVDRFYPNPEYIKEYILSK